MPMTGETQRLSLNAKLVAVRKRAAQILQTEAYWRAFLPTLGLVALYILAALLRLPHYLPDSVRLILLAGWAILCGRRLYTDLKRIPPISPHAADHRIEEVSGLKNRPLTTLTDKPAGLQDVHTTALWHAHKARTLSEIVTLKAGFPRLWPHTFFSRFATLGLIAALSGVFVLAGYSAPGRILAAFVPDWDDPDTPMPHVEAWITPPSYTSAMPVFLGSAASNPSVPQNAKLTAIVTGTDTAPVLRTGYNQIKNYKTTRLDSQSWKLEASLERSGLIRLRGRGRTLRQWAVTIEPDGVPSAEWGPSPGAQKNDWRTRLPFQAAHAFGLDSLTAELQLAHPGRGTQRTLAVPLPLSGHPKSVKGAVSPDLSEDPWAGETVTGRIVAHSVSGQSGASKPVTFRLGARVFHSPVARAVLDLRKRYALGQENREDTASDLAVLGDAPGPVQNHTGMLLNLADIVAILNNRHTDNETAQISAVNLMWDLALDIEDRQKDKNEASAQASLDVRAAQAAVAQQLEYMNKTGRGDKNAQQELKERMATLNNALARKMQALTEQAMRDHTIIPDMQNFSQANQNAFSGLMKQMQKDAMSGNPEEAMKRLQQMEDAAERMRNATPKDMAAMAQQMIAQAKAKEQAAALRDMTSKQATLLDHSQSRIDANSAEETGDSEDEGANDNYQSMPTSELLRQLGLPVPPDADNSPAPQTNNNNQAKLPDPAKAEAQAAARRNDRAVQHALQRALDELQNEFKDLTGKTPPAFAEAKQSMQNAMKALGDGEDTVTASEQQKTLDALRKGRQQMQQIMKGDGRSAPSSFLPSFGMGSGKGQGDNNQNGKGQSGKGDDGSSPVSDADGSDGSDPKHSKNDPLGRTMGSGNDQGHDESSEVPDSVARQRARDIEQELRRRDSDRTRSKQELDYLDRLLKSF
ncbi:hypothetical protein HK11_05660 [Acetobacter sp. DmW_043]|nr:hypothetical protein HK11_05660 [Acetobacter sp. DmW_043]